MNLSKRLEKLERAQSYEDDCYPVILVPDRYGEGCDIAIERWKAENDPVPENAFFIVLVALKKSDI